MEGTVNIVPPAIDPLAPKNMALSPEDASYVCAQFGIDVDRPMICQVSRFDPWKDPLGVIDAYRMVKEEIPSVQLALVGSMASDDPEGWDYFNATVAHADGDPDIHILNNFNNVGAIEVNAFQSQSDVLIQKSTREGFGLTVSEAIWKGRPFIGGNVGGIPLQVEDGVSGFLVDSVEVCAQRTLEILRDPELGKQLGRTGKEHVRKQFLTPRYLRDYLRIFTELLGEAASRHRGGLMRPPLVLVSNRGPVTFDDAGRGLARHRRPRHGADRPGLAPRRRLGRVDDDRGRRAQGARARRRAPFTVRSPQGGEYSRAARRVRPRGLRPLLQHHRQPDALVHPALPLGPEQRAGHPPPRGRGVRVRLQRRQRGPRGGRDRGDRRASRSRS